MIGRSRIPGTLVAFATAAGCAPSAYTCADDEQCQVGDRAGWCEAGGYCSFEDETCPEGRRYGDFAPPSLSGTCVAQNESSSSSSSSAAEPATTEPGTNGSTTTEPSTNTSSSTSGPASSEVSSSGGPPECLDWWDCDWAQRQTISVSALTDTPLDRFPVPVPLGPELAEAGDDLRFVDAEGTALAFEREADVAWVLLPTLPSEPLELHAYFDNPTAAPPDLEPLWSDYALVLHGDAVADATGVNVPSKGLDLPSVAGRIGPALSFGGADDVIVFPPDPSFADLREDGFTISCWLWVSSDPANDNFPRIVDNADLTEATTGWSTMLAPDTLTAERLRVDLGMSTAEDRTMFPPLTTDTWTYLAITIADDLVTARYDDAAAMGTISVVGTGTTASDADNPLAVGASAYDVTRAFLGEIDELRIVRGARDDAWLLAEYRAGLPDAVMLGDVELAPAG